MRALILGTLCALSLSTTACSKPAKPAAVLDGVLVPYLKIHDALARDTTEGVAEAVEALRAAAAPAAPKIAEAARALHGVDLKADREAFAPLGLLLAARVMADPALNERYRVIYCPMAKATWVQRGEAIRNPYFGASMLACGELRNP